MSRKPSSSRKPVTPTPSELQPYWTPNDAEWGGFINIRLTEDQSTDFHQWYEENRQEWWVLLNDALAAGLKVGSSYDAENESYIVTLTGKLLRPDAARFVLTSRAGDLEKAYALALWKHSVLAQGNYSQYMARTQNFKRFG